MRFNRSNIRFLSLKGTIEQRKATPKNQDTFIEELLEKGSVSVEKT